MAKKCGFIDCNNPATKGIDNCFTCQNRKEYTICSACRQKEPNSGQLLVFNQSAFKRKKIYRFVAKLREKAPVKFQTKIDQTLPRLKLNTSEEQLIEKAEKLISDYLSEKGGKQDNVFWFRLCSVCSPELKRRMDGFLKQNPQIKIVENKLKGEKIGPIYEEIKQEVGEERLEEIEEEIEEEIFGKAEKKDIPKPNIPDNDNNNSTEKTRLQQEINELKTEIDNLKNRPNSDDALRDKERELKEKEKELEELKNKNVPPPPQNQPPKNQNNNSNLPLYIGVSVVIIGIVCLIVGVLIAKKKKKTVVYQELLTSRTVLNPKFYSFSTLV